VESRGVVLGRFPADGVVVVDDDRVSRRHTQIDLKGDGVHLRDLGSRNGTYVDGDRIVDVTYAKVPTILRLGKTLFLFSDDLRLFFDGRVDVNASEVVGPTLRKVRSEIARAGMSGDSLLLTGPSGSGKELAARAFHAASGAKGPFIAVNCATIATGVAERLLFGNRKGAYSGATTDSEGYVQAADGGTLFLDEIAELDMSVQPKLLRVLESHEVVALGAAHPRKVDVRVCAATLRDLRVEVSAGRFREDLYYRIGRPEVRLPSLLEHLEDVPWLVCRELSRIDAQLVPQAQLLETIALRAWPGNVRELLGEVRRAAREALAEGRTLVKDTDLAACAGLEILAGTRNAALAGASATAPDPGRDAIERALRAEQGNVTRAARDLGMHRNQLRRWLARNDVDPKAFGVAGIDDNTTPSERDPTDAP
jgi:DNA-binding NtrC family response regulator